MTKPKLHFSCAAGDALRVDRLKTALVAHDLDAEAPWDDCTLFVACYSAQGYDIDEVLLARESLREHSRAESWLVALQLGDGELPDALLGMPVISLTEGEEAAIDRIRRLLPQDPAAASTLHIQTTNILGPDILFE